MKVLLHWFYESDLVTLMFSKTGTPKKTKAFSVIYKRLHEMIPSTVKEVSK